MPGLDGLRAIAVLAVIAYHLDFGWAPGGLLGVGVFFTLSGYLITDLLLGTRAATGSLKLGEFWIRRARRLLPALFVMIVAVVAWVTLFERTFLSGLRGDVIAAFFYVSNWWNIAREASYFARFGPPPPLEHLWSLAVEEQFYLIWPWLVWLVLFVTRKRPVTAGLALTGLALGLSAASVIAMWVLYQPGIDPTRVYEGTDTRAFGLLIGAALAVVWPSRALSASLAHRSRVLLDGIGVMGLVIIALLIWRTSEYSPFMYHGGILLLTLATTATVAALAHPATVLGTAVGWAPLRWIGVRSYGIYLWHWPIIVLTAPTPGSGADPHAAGAAGGGYDHRGRDLLAVRGGADSPRGHREPVGKAEIRGVATSGIVPPAAPAPVRRDRRGARAGWRVGPRCRRSVRHHQLLRLRRAAR